MPIGLVVAALGGEFEVPTLTGKAMLKIGEGTQSGKVFRLRGMGLKSVRGGGTGDLLCTVVVETPMNLNRKQKELLRELGESFGGDQKHSPEASSWLDKAKQFIETHLKS